MFNKIAAHYGDGHTLVIALYGNVNDDVPVVAAGDAENIAIECIECCEVIVDAYQDEDEA